jgi:hypothetical protein
LLHTSFLAQRWQADAFSALWRKYVSLASAKPFVVAVPQDEFLQTQALGECLEAFATDLVLTCADDEDARRIYGHGPKFKLRRVLTGYLELNRAKHVGSFGGRPTSQRSIDIGYRAWKSEPWLGRHGMLKRVIAEETLRRNEHLGLRLDISVEASDVIHGDGWYRFLGSCKATLGVEGGSSILDRDGTIRRLTLEYLMREPDATFDEVERHCFPESDGSLRLFCLSPRHLEAAATGTAQLLIEGRYNDLLEPEQDYYPIRSDLSNLTEAMAWVKSKPHEVAAMAERARRKVLASPHLTYSAFVSDFEQWLVDAGVSVPERKRRGIDATTGFAWAMTVRETLSATRLRLWQLRQRQLLQSR